MKSDLLYWYWLRDVKNIGPARVSSLVEHFGSPKDVYDASSQEYRQVEGIGKGLAKAIAESKSEIQNARDMTERERQIAAEFDVSILTLLDPKYPDLLKEQPAAAPPILYVRGSLERLSTRAVAIVGTRGSSRRGEQWAMELAENLAAEGWSVISGLALGIDAAGHRGVLKAGGHTLAVLGCGVDQVYPPENRDLFASILDKGGAVVSEYPLGTPPRADNLRRRNELIVALSQAVVVAECPASSGALIAAQDAFDQVKPVFAFSFTDARASARGSQALLKEGQAKAISPRASAEELSFEIELFHATDLILLCDLDGVLADTTHLTRNALMHAFENEMDGLVHLSPRAALKRLCSTDIDTLQQSFDQYWRKRYSEEIRGHSRVRSTLERLPPLGVALGVVTSRNKEQATSALRALAMESLFETVVTWGKTARHKPDPEPLRAALDQLGDATAAIYLGDQPEDVAAAKAAGALAVGVTWFLDERQVESLRRSEPDYLVDQPSELFDLVMRLKRERWSAL
jgi:DNA processing protein